MLNLDDFSKSLILFIIIFLLTEILPSISHSQAAAIEPNIFAETIELFEARHKEAYASNASPAPTASTTFLVKDGVANERLIILLGNCNSASFSKF